MTKGIEHAIKKVISMVGRYLTIVWVLMCLASTVTAGLDRDRRFDNVIAVYHFEDVRDSGPRDFDGVLLREASIVNSGRIGKCLRLRNEGSFSTIEDQYLSIIDGEFSIVAWVKLWRQPIPFKIVIVGINDDDTDAGNVQILLDTSGEFVGIHVSLQDFIQLESIQSNDHNIFNNRWHHIAFTKYADTYTLFVDGEIIDRKRSNDYLPFTSDGTFIYIGGPNNEDLRASIYVDEVGFFERGFSVYEIQGLYDDGLADFLEAMPVDPRTKVATTWGAMKRNRW